MSLRDAIAALTMGGPYTVLRTTAGTIVKGHYTPSNDVDELTVAGSLQPVSGRELQDLPEGQRGDEVRVLYTRTEIKTREPGFEPDIIVLGDENWTCIRVERFDAFADTHWRAYFSRSARP